MSESTRKALEKIARATVSGAFRNRRGHGGGAHITKRVLTREQLETLILAALIFAADERDTS